VREGEPRTGLGLSTGLPFKPPVTRSQRENTSWMMRQGEGGDGEVDAGHAERGQATSTPTAAVSTLASARDDPRQPHIVDEEHVR